VAAEDDALLDAFNLGWNIALEVHGVDPSSPAGQRLQLYMMPRLLGLAISRETAVANSEEVARELFPGVPKDLADGIRDFMPAMIARDREIAARVLRAMAGE
jgi:hypothetical protein